VIQRRQVLLVQVVKEERGNKGAALTTYLSLAGRYCVLMPNTSHGGGISRKISNGSDRKRLKSIIADLSLPGTMGLIVRTAGLERTKTEIKRDFDYLARLWDEVRETTLSSAAPALIYRDSDLVKRAIRDLYHRDIDEVLVEGEDGYRAARGYMKLLMPSHVKKVQPHNEATPLFQRYGVEDQLAAMYHPLVQLKSGGYIVINPTEALVSIDINSGRSTREHNIEQTAFATNLEAAQEIARQLRLRDMAGLVVIDFIDMEQNSHVRKVEKAMKEALKNDRARIQVGRISSFGLMEMSRQRLRTGVLEASTKSCPHCDGTGLMRTASSAGLSALRMLEDEAARGRGDRVCLRAGAEAAIYVLNRKRAELADIEARYGVSVEVLLDPSFEGARMAVESSGPRPVAPIRQPAPPLAVELEPEIDEENFLEDEIEESEENEEREERDERGAAEDGEDRNGRRRRRRRRGGRNRRREGEPGEGEAGEPERSEDSDEEEQLQPIEAEGAEAPGFEDEGGSEEERRKRRGRRGGRRRGGRGRSNEEGG
jgi:ribonuclease E